MMWWQMQPLDGSCVVDVVGERRIVVVVCWRKQQQCGLLLLGGEMRRHDGPNGSFPT